MSRSTRDHDRDKAIFEARLTGRTLADVGKEFGISGARIRQIEGRVLRDQRRAHRDKTLYDACLSGRPFGEIAAEFELSISRVRDLQDRLLRERAERDAVTRG